MSGDGTSADGRYISRGVDRADLVRRRNDRSTYLLPGALGREADGVAGRRGAAANTLRDAGHRSIAAGLRQASRQPFTPPRPATPSRSPALRISPDQEPANRNHPSKARSYRSTAAPWAYQNLTRSTNTPSKPRAPLPVGAGLAVGHAVLALTAEPVRANVAASSSTAGMWIIRHTSVLSAIICSSSFGPPGDSPGLIHFTGRLILAYCGPGVRFLSDRKVRTWSSAACQANRSQTRMS